MMHPVFFVFRKLRCFFLYFGFMFNSIRNKDFTLQEYVKEF